jgi:hypothetical protein
MGFSGISNSAKKRDLSIDCKIVLFCIYATLNQKNTDKIVIHKDLDFQNR